MYIPKGGKYYGQIIKRKITKLQELYNIAKECLEVTSASFLIEEVIWAKSELQNVSDSIKCIYPYFYELWDLMGNRISVCDHAITNSKMDMVTNFMD